MNQIICHDKEFQEQITETRLIMSLANIYIKIIETFRTFTFILKSTDFKLLNQSELRFSNFYNEMLYQINEK